MSRKGLLLTIGVIGILAFCTAKADNSNTNGNLNSNSNSNINSNANTNGNLNTNTNSNSNSNSNLNSNSNSNGNNNSNANSNANSNTNTNINSAAIQTITGEVTASGNFGIDIQKENLPTNWSAYDISGPSGNFINYTFENNTLYVSDGRDEYNDTIDGKRAYIAVTFDQNGNIINTRYGSARMSDITWANVCEGDNNACKNMSWFHFKLRLPRTLTCNYSCDQKNDYKYEVRYENKVNDTFSLLDPANVNKCADLRGLFTPSAEWFGTLTHTCSFSGGEKVLTIDTISPPTDLLTCADQASCLNSATEASLTSTTFGKGVQKIPNNLISTVQNSLNAGQDPDIKCANGICDAYASGSHQLAVNIPAASYLGQCRGTVSSETVEGKTFSTPEVKVNTAEVNIPAASSVLKLNVVNRAPIVNVSFAKSTIAPDESVQVTCDAVDPDSCVDKIVKIKWNCFDYQGKQVNCFFLDSNEVWRANTLTQELSDTQASNPYRATANFKATVSGGYAVSCEATDNDANNPLSGLGIAGVAVGNGGEVPASMKFCAVISDEGSNQTLCGNSAKVNYTAYQSGITPDQYEWKCSNSDTAQLGDANKQCNYSNSGTYSPSLRIHDQVSNQWVDCVTQSETKITNQQKCKVGLRKAGTTDEFASQLSIKMGDEAEAKVTRECMDKGNITWNVQNGQTIGDTNKETIKLKFNAAGIGTVKANTQGVDCDQAQADVKETLQFGQ